MLSEGYPYPTAPLPSSCPSWHMPPPPPVTHITPHSHHLGVFAPQQQGYSLGPEATDALHMGTSLFQAMVPSLSQPELKRSEGVPASSIGGLHVCPEHLESLWQGLQWTRPCLWML